MRKLVPLLVLFAATAPLSPVYADAMDDYAAKFLKWNAETKDLQKSGDVRGAGGVVQPVPSYLKGKEAILEVTDKNQPCHRRYLIGSDCLFEFGKSRLTKDAEDTLKVLGPMLEKVSTHPITIEGHTDSIDTDEKNQILSEKRAEQVKNWLMQNHYIPTDTKMIGYGEKQPVAPNEKDGKDYPAGRALNRRVCILVDTCATRPVEPAPTSTTGGSQPGAAAQPAAAPAAPISVVNLSEMLPSSDLFTSEEVKARFALLNATPLNDAALSYEILAPVDWEETPPVISRELLAQESTEQIPIGNLSPKNASDVCVEIRYTKAPEDVNLSSFIKAFAGKRGYELLARQPGEFNGHQVEDALLKSGQNDQSKLMRLTVMRHAGRIFLVASSCPEKDYSQWKKVFGAAAVSFNPKGN